MTDTQFALSIIGIFLLIYGAMNALLFYSLKIKIDSLQDQMNSRFEAINHRFDGVHQAILRVEGILDSRLKHLEEK